jgi:hypothetical protein
MRRLMALGLLASALAAVPPAGAAPLGAPCQLTGGFRALHDLIPGQVGDCVEDARAEPTTGNTLQRTSGGLLVWRRLGNWTAFTDGADTWVSGPFGLQQRLATERFDWEDVLAPAVVSAAPPGQPAPPPAPTVALAQVAPPAVPPPLPAPAVPASCAPAVNNDDPIRAIAFEGGVDAVLPPAIWSRSSDQPDRISYRYYTFSGNGRPATLGVEVADDGGYKVRVNLYAPDGSLVGNLYVGAHERQELFLLPSQAGPYMVQLWNYRPAEVQFHLDVRRG